MEWITIVSLLVFGVLLLVVEIILVPGTTVVGLAGVIFMGVGIWLGFRDLGLVYGYWMLAFSVAALGLALYFGLKNQTWQKFTLTNENHARVNEDVRPEVELGEIGKTLSSLRPSGTGFFHGKQYEVQTNGEFIPTGSQIRIIKIAHHKITVELAG